MNRTKQFPIASQLREKAHMYVLAVDDLVRRLAPDEEPDTISMIQDAVHLAIAELYVGEHPRLLDEQRVRELVELRRHSPDVFAERMDSFTPVHNLFEASNSLIREIETSDETTTRRSQTEQETLDLIQRLATEIADQEGLDDEPIGIILDALMLASQERMLQGLTDPASNADVSAALELRLNSVEQFDSRIRASGRVWEPLHQLSSDAES